MRERLAALVRAGDFPVYATASWTTVVGVAAAAVGWCLGTYPVLRAARLSPIETIRHE